MSLGNIIAIIKAAIDLWRLLTDMVKRQNSEAAQKEYDEKQKAIADARKAQSLKEAQDAQRRINNPGGN